MMSRYKVSGFIGLAPSSSGVNSHPFLGQMKDSLDNSQFSIYLTDDHTYAQSTLQFGGYDLKYAKEGSTDEDINWVDMGDYDKSWTVGLYDAYLGDQKLVDPS